MSSTKLTCELIFPLDLIFIHFFLCFSPSFYRYYIVTYVFIERLDEETKNVRVRKYGEVLASAVSSVAAALEYPKELIKDSVRPEYWAKDSDSPSCTLCDQIFGNNIDDMEQSKIRELSNASGNVSGLQNSPIHAILDIRRHHVIHLLTNLLNCIFFICLL